MLPPTHPYNISGTVYSNSLIKGRSDIRVTITGSGGKTNQHIYIGGGTKIEKGLTLYVKNLNTKEVYPKPVITSSTTGKYLFDCRNFAEGHSTNDIILIRASTVTPTLNVTEDRDEGTVRQNEYHELAGARKRLPVNEDGNEYNADNPLPILISSETLDFMNVRKVLTKGGPNGRLSQIDYYYKGKQYRKTITYSGNTEDHSAIVEV